MSHIFGKSLYSINWFEVDNVDISKEKNIKLSLYFAQLNHYWGDINVFLLITHFKCDRIE